MTKTTGFRPVFTAETGSVLLYVCLDDHVAQHSGEWEHDGDFRNEERCSAIVSLRQR